MLPLTAAVAFKFETVGVTVAALTGCIKVSPEIAHAIIATNATVFLKLDFIFSSIPFLALWPHLV